MLNGQSFNDALSNDIVSFEQLGPDLCESAQVCAANLAP